MKEILIPLNFTPNPVVYDTEQSFSTADESSAVLAFSTTESLSGVVASLTIKNISQNANLTTVLIDRIEVNTSPFRYTFVKPLASGDYYGEIILKRNLEAIGSAQFTFGVNSSLAAEVLPHLIQAYSLDDLVEQVEAEINNLKAAYNLNVETAEARISSKETTITGKESIRALNETQRKANELTRIDQELSRVAAEGERQETFTTLVDSAVIEQVVVQEVAEKYIEIEAKQASRLLSAEQQLADTLNKSAITLTHMFADSTARDAYFVSHPTELVDLQFIKVGTGYQQYIEGLWQASSAIVAEQVSATNQPIVDTGNYFATDKTNDALQELGAHKASTANPHGVTKAQVGLGNVDNTSDANKPVSTAGQTALNLKANKAQEAFVTPTLLNGWTAFTGYENLKYYKTEFGEVRVFGILSSGTTTALTQIIALPAGYRTTTQRDFSVVTSDGTLRPATLKLLPGGRLVCGSDVKNIFLLVDITFRAEV